MRRLFVSVLLLGALAIALPASAATGKVIKVLPQYLDLKGQSAKSPSLFDRDAYQAWLRENPKQRSGVRYAVQWRAKPTFGTLKLRVQLRGVAQGNVPREKTIERELKSGGRFSHWDELDLKGDDYKSIGKVTAWRVTLWDGDTLLDEQASFLWQSSSKADEESKP